MNIKRWKNAARLLLTSPGDFVRVVRHRGRLFFANSRLRFRTWRAQAGVLWVDHGWAEFPFHGDGDIQELLYYVYGNEWRRNEIDALMPYVQPGNTVLDVGANVGFITCILSQLVGGAGFIHSFEPSQSVREKLTATVSRNHLLNVTIHPYACGESSASLELCSTTGSSGNATLTGVSDVGMGGERVNVVRLDDYLLPLIDKVDFIKIDTEGFEDQVLAGAAQLVERFKPTFYIELSQEYRESSLVAIQWLKERGYRFPIEPDLDKSHNGDNFIATCRE